MVQLKMLDANLRKFNWDKPYIVTEWGVNGPFEAKTTSWKAKMNLQTALKQTSG